MSNHIYETVTINGNCYSRIRYQYAPAEYAVEKFRDGGAYWSTLNSKAHKKIIAKIEQELAQ